MAASDFIAKYGSAADAVSKETGIPAERILGQAGLETGWNSAPPGNNFFGIKGPGLNLATHEADASGALVPTTQSFRAYADPTDSFRDYGRLIQSGYKSALDPNLDDAGFAKAIKAGGYATDPNYVVKLHGSIQTARQHHSGGWETVGDAAPIGAGAGFGDGRDDKGWETVATAAPAEIDTPAPPQAGSAPGDYSLGGLAQNAATDAGDIWRGIKATGKRAVDDVGSAVQGNFAPAAGDVLGIMKSLNPFLATAKGIQQGAPMVQSAINDPAQAAKNVADYAYQKPVSTAMNAAAVAFPGAGGATRAALAAPGKVAGPLVRGGTELLSGVSSEAQKLASKAGEIGGAEGGAFRSQMANPDAAAMQRTGQQAKQGARAERAENYNAGMDDVAMTSPQPLHEAYGPVIEAAQDARASAYDNGFLKHTGVPPVMANIDKAINQHFNNPLQTGNASSMDALKQRLRGIMMAEKEGTPARRAAAQVYHALADKIESGAPDYAKVMAKYGDESDNLSNAVSSLGLGERATRFSTSGKLLAALRPDSVAGTARADSLAAMTKHEPTLPFQIAGATMHPGLPRGIVGRGSAILHAGAVGGAAAFIPALIKALPMLIAASPRAVGEARYAIGAAKRGARSVGVTQKNIGNLVDALRLISTKQNQDQ